MQISRLALKAILDDMKPLTGNPVVLALQTDNPHQVLAGQVSVESIRFLVHQANDGDDKPVLLLHHPAVLSRHNDNLVVAPMDGINEKFYVSLDAYVGIGKTTYLWERQYLEWLNFHTGQDAK